MDKSRLRRIEASMQNELARLLQEEIADPRLKGLTITGVSVSADLSHAKIYVVGHDESQMQGAMVGLKSAASLLRYRLANIMKLRKMPLLHFYYDLSLRESSKIDQLLDEVAKRMQPESDEGES